MRSEVAVLGAGLTGITAALTLAQSGVDVALIERDGCVMNRASLRNEGKIHLGFVFAHDDSMAPAKLMLKGALSFRSILARLAGPRIDALRVSRPFVYVVAGDSLLAPNEVERRFRTIESFYRTSIADDPDLDYLGSRTPTILSHVARAALEPHLRTDGLRGAYRTAEVAIDTEELAGVLRDAVAAAPRITVLKNHTVRRVDPTGAGLVVTGTADGRAWELEARHVINATWENRFAIDRTAGLTHAPGWLHRLKYRVIARVPETMRDGPSVTMVIGRYGDVVVRPDGTAYFSWYPAGLQGWTHALAPPAAWNEPCMSHRASDKRHAIAAEIIAGIAGWYPAAAASAVEQVDAGAIVAYGASDVDDPRSGLHGRTRVGVRSAGAYHSVDPGKLTTAPLFGAQAAHAVLHSMVAV